MKLPNITESVAASGIESPGMGISPLTIERLADDQQVEVLEFLARHPIHTVFLTGFIRDNGLESHLNRGIFYGCRNFDGLLEGVALIGHAVLMETRSEEAVAAFARVAQGYSDAHMIMGEQEKIESFWRYYSAAGQPLRLVCRELLYSLRRSKAIEDPVAGLRLARLDDLELILSVNDQMAYEESGINPLQTDPDGFRRRWVRRIEQGRVWVLVDEGELIYKTDIISDTPEVTYLEGVYVNPEYRGKGIGSRCISQLGTVLLERTKCLSLLVNERNKRAQAFFSRAGYEQISLYDTIFLKQGIS